MDKYAVLRGGGFNHRIGLFDGLLVKDNHLSETPVRELSNFLVQVVQRSRAEKADRLVEIEVDALEQLREVLKVDGVNVILLDNMAIPLLREAVEKVAGRARLEASGGLTLDRARAVAETGVDFLAVGALTHSAPSLDVALDWEA